MTPVYVCHVLPPAFPGRLDNRKDPPSLPRWVVSGERSKMGPTDSHTTSYHHLNRTLHSLDTPTHIIYNSIWWFQNRHTNMSAHTKEQRERLRDLSIHYHSTSIQEQTTNYRYRKLDWRGYKNWKPNQRILQEHMYRKFLEDSVYHKVHYRQDQHSHVDTYYP